MRWESKGGGNAEAERKKPSELRCRDLHTQCGRVVIVSSDDRDQMEGLSLSVCRPAAMRKMLLEGCPDRLPMASKQASKH